jgi:hypothetical protein
VLKRLAEHGLIKGERLGVDASTIEANAALRTIIRRDSGEGYREMLTHMAQESGIETPTVADLVRLDRKRKGKKLSNADWESPTDPDARIAKLKDGRTHLAYKPEHALDLDTGAVVAAEMHLADGALGNWTCHRRCARGGEPSGADLGICEGEGLLEGSGCARRMRLDRVSSPGHERTTVLKKTSRIPPGCCLELAALALRHSQ